ncbi:response regulator [Cohnella sp. REN36]|uniref:response regulator n=1 Tax=Cohnella sp. REN36 TaxID=2887347 RepID=UPI001D13A7C8|nr:response regulator [Cohnella sp. REN36]MCC3376733.1 response regulator [Cohnella sp. REN36]
MTQGRRFGIRAKITLGYLIIIACLGIAMVILNSRISSMEKEMNFITNHDIEVQNLSNQLEKRVLDMVSGHRGYLISDDLSYLEPYTAAKNNYGMDYRKLYELVSDNSAQRQNLESIKANIDDWLTNMGEPTVALKRQGNDAEIRKFYADNVGKDIMDKIRLQLDDFRTTELGLTHDRIAELDRNNASTKYALYILVLAITALSIVVSFVISGTIVKTVKQVAHTIADIAAAGGGSRKVKRIEVNANDEIKDLGDATNRLLQSHEDQNWLQTSIADVATAAQGYAHIAELADSVMSRLASLLPIAYGAVYQLQDQSLVRVASYAGSGADPSAERLRLGEGLPGQCALERRVLRLDPAPEGHIAIASALGQSSPRSILMVPVEFEGRVRGVIELASAESLTPLHRQLLEQTRSVIGTALYSVETQMEVSRLLEESQALSEELQAQTEELQQQTEELQTQSEELIAQQDELKASNDALRQSEERLQRQQEELEQLNEDLSSRSDLLEREMRRAEEINGQVERQNALLEKQASDLMISSRYKSEFLANMSHELRTPLNSLLILSQLLADNKEGNLSPKQVDFAQTIHASGSDLLRLIDEVLDLSKVEAGQMKIEAGAVHLTDVVDALRRGFQPMAAKKGIEFRIRAENHLPETIRTDAHRVQQILRNLLSNAFKFTSAGHVTLHVFRAKRALLAAAEEEAIAFAVIDTGIGIPKANQEIIFEAFQQADGTTSRKYGGTGLGLTISRELAGLLGGEIEMSSEEGKGSTFTLYLPALPENGEYGEYVAQAAATREAALPAPAEPVLAPALALDDPELLKASEIEDDRDRLEEGDQTLLIVEDDAHFAKIMLDMARERGFKGLVALRGDKGLALAKAYKPAAIMLDIQLPVVDGWTVLERLKQDAELRHIPVHVISVVDEPQQGLTMGAMAYLQKPVSKETIDKALHRVESFINRDLKRLLIVEDDVVLRDSLVKLIGHDDVAITAVSTGAEALAELDKQSFDCMVLDLGLSDMTGFELLDRIRPNQELRQLPIIIYTGKELDMKEEMELKKYAESIIIKNVKSQERLFDETALFLHRVEANLPEDRRNMLKKLYANETAFADKRILLVEDDMRNIFALTNVLESYRLKISFAENGKEALDMLSGDDDFDLILMDIMMPEMDGYEAMRAIRQMPRFRQTPIIALTAKAMKEDRRRCMDAGASDYISKPIDIDKLLSLLKVWLYK